MPKNLLISKLELLSLIVLALFVSLVNFGLPFHCLTLLFGSALFVFYVVLQMGDLALRFCREKRDFHLSFVSGYFLLSIALLIPALTLKVPITLDFFVVAALVGVTRFIVRPTTVQTSRHDMFGLLGLLLGLLASLIWSQENLAISHITDGHWYSPPWQDIFFHAVQITKFVGIDFGAKIQSQVLAGQAPELYHYGSYTLVALLAKMGSIDSLQAAHTLYGPIGFLLMGLAAYTLGHQVYGPRGGLASLIVTCYLPDPSFIGLGSGWTSFFFFQTVGIAGSYGVAAMAIALCFIWTDLKESNPNHYKKPLMAICLIAVSALFKVQIFLVYSLMLGLFWLTESQRFNRRTKLVACAFVIVLYGLGTVLLKRIPNAPQIKLALSGGRTEIATIAEFNYANPVITNFLKRGLSSRVGSALGVIVLPLMHFGSIFLLGVCIYLSKALLLPLRIRELKLVGLILINYLIVSLCIAPNTGRGDAHEIIHKTFVWPYFVLAVIVGGAAAALWRTWPFRTLILSTGFALLVTVDFSLTTHNQARLAPPWLPKLSNITIPYELYEAAEFVKTSANPREIVQLQIGDPLLAVLSIIGHPAYFSRNELETSAPTDIERKRKNEVFEMNDKEETKLVKFSKQHGITWWIFDNALRKSKNKFGDLKIKSFGQFEVVHIL